MTKDLTQREGYFNRHTDPLPTDRKCFVIIICKDFTGEHKIPCQWTPVDESSFHDERDTPSRGYLGTARTMRGITIGFHAWEQNDHEFIYYKPLNIDDEKDNSQADTLA